MENFTLNILIVEDDLSLAIDLEMIVDEMGYKVIGRADNSVDALRMIKEQSPDLILMDIDIKGNLTGIQIAKKIRHRDIPVLFITSLNDQKHFNRAKQTNYIGYLVKPVNKFTLRGTIETTFKKLSESENAAPENQKQEAFPLNDALFFKKRGILHKIMIHDILYISADDDYTITVTEVGEFISSLRLYEIEKLLPETNFLKTHRSHLVNLNKMSSFDPTKGVLKIGAREIPVSRRNRPIVLEKIQFIK